VSSTNRARPPLARAARILPARYLSTGIDVVPIWPKRVMRGYGGQC